MEIGDWRIGDWRLENRGWGMGEGDLRIRRMTMRFEVGATGLDGCTQDGREFVCFSDNAFQPSRANKFCVCNDF